MERFDDIEPSPITADALRAELRVRAGIAKAEVKLGVLPLAAQSDRERLLGLVSAQRDDVMELIELAENEYPKVGIDPRTAEMIRREISLLLENARSRMEFGEEKVERMLLQVQERAEVEEPQWQQAA